MVVGLEKDANDHIVALTYEQDGKKIREEADVFISSMPIRDLVGGMNDVPEKEAKIAAGLPYRDYRTLGVLVRKLNLENKTKIMNSSGFN